jgi:site-specific DNA-methyltransferase (cytosine-N4-specific)
VSPTWGARDALPLKAGAAAPDRKLGRRYIGIDLNPAYHDLARERFAQGVLDFDATA